MPAPTQLAKRYGNNNVAAPVATFPAGVAAGATVLCFVFFSKQTSVAVSSVTGLGATWTKLGSVIDTTATEYLEVWRGTSPTAGLTTVTVTFTGTGNKYSDVLCAEYALAAGALASLVGIDCLDATLSPAFDGTVHIPERSSVTAAAAGDTVVMFGVRYINTVYNDQGGDLPSAWTYDVNGETESAPIVFGAYLDLARYEAGTAQAQVQARRSVYNNGTNVMQATVHMGVPASLVASVSLAATASLEADWRVRGAPNPMAVTATLAVSAHAGPVDLSTLRQAARQQPDTDPWVTNVALPGFPGIYYAKWTVHDPGSGVWLQFSTLNEVPPTSPLNITTMDDDSWIDSHPDADVSYFAYAHVGTNQYAQRGRQTTGADTVWGPWSIAPLALGDPFWYIRILDNGPFDYVNSADQWYTDGLTAPPDGYVAAFWDGTTPPTGATLSAHAVLAIAGAADLTSFESMDAELDLDAITAPTPPAPAGPPPSAGPLPDPTVAPALSRVSGGDLPAGSYDYRYQAWRIEPVHHTAASPIATITVPTDSGVEVDIPDVLGANGYRVFRRGPDNVWVYVGDVEVL